MSLPVVHVACGVLQKPGGEVLLAQRPDGKIAAGYWEFPGGKIEPGETGREALARELFEELGIQVRAARPLIRLRHAYGDRIVVLDTYLVTGFAPDPQPRENQALAWVALAQVQAYHCLPTVAPILAPLRLPTDYVFTPPQIAPADLRAGLAGLPRRALLRLRLPALAAAPYATLARRLLADATPDLRLLLDRDPSLSRELGCGFHASAAVWRTLTERPVPVPLLFIGSAHCRDDISRLAALGADAAVLGNVLATASHPGRGALGWSGFADAASEAGIPVYAIGGVGPGDHVCVWDAGGQGCAGITAYWPR